MNPEGFFGGGDNDYGAIIFAMAGAVAHEVLKGNKKFIQKVGVNSMYGKTSQGASTIYNSQAVGREMSDLFPGLEDSCTCPKCHNGTNNSYEGPIFAIVIHLNDAHGWTREQIADWLDTLETDLTLAPTQKGN